MRRSNEEIYSNGIGFMGTAGPRSQPIAHESARRARLVMTTFVVTFRNSIPAASTTAGRPSGKRSAYAENASGRPRKGGRGRPELQQDKSPGPLATFMNGAFAPGTRARPGLQVSRCHRFEHAKNQERSFGAKTPLRMTWSGMVVAFAPSG